MSRKLATLVGLILICLLLSGFAGPMQGTEESAGTPWWVWLLIIVVFLFAAFLWWLWWSRRGEEKALPAVEPEPVPPVQAAEVIEAPTKVAEVVPPEPDDLEIIEGIGPKIAGLLNAAGITTFAQLAEADLTRVQTILDAANLRLADPTTWAEQARLAAAGDQAGLEALKNQLKGGRRA
jgi:predicted flap endonuclease-1-like 5' DNA nuclease